MTQVLFITHADVAIDPAVPVPDWGLSSLGKRRHLGFNQRAAELNVTEIYSSAERKALDGAEILSDHLGVAVQIIESLHENDRSATGYLPPAEFEAMADRFFAEPEVSVSGWETALAAQQRVLSAMDTIKQRCARQGAVAVVAHGGVGTLLLCHLSGLPISRDHDQPGSGGGNYFAYDLEQHSLLHGWLPI